jgi:hypothetical protein
MSGECASHVPSRGGQARPQKIMTSNLFDFFFVFKYQNEGRN